MSIPAPAPSAETTAKTIMHLFYEFGHEEYDGEPVSQTAHMVQSAMLAMDDGADLELVVAAFLHDIGHLLKHTQPTQAMGSYGVLNHEAVGAAYLRSSGFSERVCEVVAQHVTAKRYLVATDDQYAKRLSEASRQTLLWQGGPMSAAEATAFEQQRFFNDSIRVRLWDEAAKQRHAVLLPLSHFQTLIRQHLTDQPQKHETSD